MANEIEELRECVKAIKESTHKIELSHAITDGMVQGFMKSTDEFLKAIRKDVYSKDGIVDRVGNHEKDIGRLWKLLGVGGILSVLLMAIVVILFK